MVKNVNDTFYHTSFLLVITEEMIYHIFCKLNSPIAIILSEYQRDDLPPPLSYRLFIHEHGRHFVIIIDLKHNIYVVLFIYLVS